MLSSLLGMMVGAGGSLHRRLTAIETVKSSVSMMLLLESMVRAACWVLSSLSLQIRDVARAGLVLE